MDNELPKTVDNVQIAQHLRNFRHPLFLRPILGHTIIGLGGH